MKIDFKIESILSEKAFSAVVNTAGKKKIPVEIAALHLLNMYVGGAISPEPAAEPAAKPEPAQEEEATVPAKPQFTNEALEAFDWLEIKRLGEQGLEGIKDAFEEAGIQTLQQAYDFEYKDIPQVGKVIVERIKAKIKDVLGDDFSSNADDVDEILNESEETPSITLLDEFEELLGGGKEEVLAARDLYMRATNLDSKQVIDLLVREGGFVAKDKETYPVAIKFLRDNLPVQDEQLDAIYKLGESMGESRESIESDRPELLFGEELSDLTVFQAEEYLASLESDDSFKEDVDEMNDLVDEGFFG